ncbi:hypothetical protein KDA23_03870 [Candidatus Saccharibacteria bacterium]|nr:hypothetical protein [Candidatus Saccharibacteria bacterium]
MSSQTPKPVALWKIVLATILLFVLINFVFETVVEATRHDLHGYYPLTRIVIMLLTIAGVVIYRRKTSK